MLRALERLIREGINAHLILIGMGKDYARLQELAQTLSIRDHVTFLGHLHEDQFAYMARSDIVVTHLVDQRQRCQRNVTHSSKEFRMDNSSRQVPCSLQRRAGITMQKIAETKITSNNVTKVPYSVLMALDLKRIQG